MLQLNVDNLTTGPILEALYVAKKNKVNNTK